MSHTASIRERTKAQNSLVCLLQSLEGMETTVELRDESSVKGTINGVDGFMAISMSDVVFTDRHGNVSHMSDFFVQGRNIRFVQVPDEVNMIEAIQKQLSTMNTTRTMGTQWKKKRETVSWEDLKAARAKMAAVESQNSKQSVETESSGSSFLTELELGRQFGLCETAGGSVKDSGVNIAETLVHQSVTLFEKYPTGSMVSEQVNKASAQVIPVSAETEWGASKGNNTENVSQDFANLQVDNGVSK